MSIRGGVFAAAQTLIFHAVALHYFFKWDSAVITIANAFQRTLGKIYVLEISQVLQDRLADVIAFAAPGPASQPVQSFFDRLRKPDGQHLSLPI
jgi:hypothetical protein